MKIGSYFAGAWHAGKRSGQPLVNPVNQNVLAHVDSSGLDLSRAFDYARSVGLPSLAELSFAERGAVLKSIAEVLIKHRDRYVEIARLNSGNTARDASIDIDGGIGVLKFYARAAERLGKSKLFIEPGQDQLAKEPVFFSRHIWNTRPGVALQINAFNFPSWGMWEKVATAFIAGVPSVVKPATSTAWLSAEMVGDVVAEANIPAGSISLICGQAAPLVECLSAMDSLAFTGSSGTALLIRGSLHVLESGARLNIEADSLNSTVIGPDAAVGGPLFALAVREIVKALSVKAGQLCTNIRRVLVHESILPALQDAVAAEISRITIGDPAGSDIQMGPLVNLQQRDAALEGITKLSKETKLVAGAARPHTLSEADWLRGAFIAPTLLRCDDPSGAENVHHVEVFGPCVTLMSYRTLTEAAALIVRGGGSLAASVFSNDAEAAADLVAALGPWHGRLLVIDETVGKNHTGHPIVMPQCVHGGPGRAGSGEEQGGLRALRFHMQRTALQGSPQLFQRLSSAETEFTL